MLYRPFSPNSPSVAMNYALHCSQTDACTFKLLDGVQALKRAEQFICILHIKSCAVITDVVYRLAILLHNAKNVVHACLDHKDRKEHDQQD